MKNQKLLLVILMATACKGRDESAPAAYRDQSAVTTPMAESRPMDGELAASSSGAALDERTKDRADDAKAPAPVMPREEAIDAAKEAGILGAMGPGGGSFATIGGQTKGGKNRPTNGVESATRAWFPETFLFEPLVVTDPSGLATVPVRVPDRLTTWHVLALAHSRQGAQGGATTSFLGTLPTYVDLVVPKFLVVGDQIRLPVQMINTTPEAAASSLELGATNAAITGPSGARTIPAQGSLVEYATLTANKAGVAQVRAGLGSTDAVLRTIDVRPSGKPVSQTRSGTLAAPRVLSIAGTAGADPTTDRVRLLVFPGALALLRSELGVSMYREGVADDAYALLLAGRAAGLLQALGDKADPEALRTLSILTGQRAIRDGRTLDVMSAALLAEAALAHGNNPVLSRLGERAVGYLAQNQRPDGTFAGGAGWTLQRVLVATADATRAVGADSSTLAGRQRAMGVAARAAGAFERNLERVEDGYTAAAILASGASHGELAEKLKTKVLAAIKTAPDGSKYLDVGEGVVRADGGVPSTAEATALAVLALDGDPKAPLADLGSTLLGSYSPERGWGDGRANLACMQAVLALFKTPVPEGVRITLTMDGTPVTEGTLDRAALRQVLALEAPAAGLAGTHEWKIVAEPAVPGLGYSLSLNSWVPWPKETTNHGLELALPGAMTGEVGKPLEIALSAIAPSGIEVKIEQSLPAGVQVDTPSLEALVAAGTISRFETADGKLELTVPALQPGQTFAAKYRVIPTLAGTLHSSASKISAGATEFHVPPTTWTVR